MNAAPYTHLVWKEYRAIRGFWIALLGLALFMQLLVLAFSQDLSWATEFVYNITLATPVFFAIGCIGTAYAIEKEDGTFDWLRASPASNSQLLVSKVGLCLVATLAMFGILWLATSTLLVAPPVQTGVMRGLLGLWLLAAAEALAWGLFFSLLSARPLTAIVLALFATSTSVHLLSYAVQTNSHDQFEYARYSAAIPYRLGLFALVAAADAYLGLRWLGSEERASLLAPREVEDASARRPATKADITALLRHRDRATILGRITWQTFRQSGRMMLTLAALQVLLSLMFSNSGLENSAGMLLPVFGVISLAAIMGASVFQADQQRGHFRFFVEHNVPPRYVWFGRLLPWFLVATLSTLLSLCMWVGPWLVLKIIVVAAQYVGSLPAPFSFQEWWDREVNRQAELFVLAIIMSPLSMLAFIAGQWVSMTVRSGLLAGFFSLLLAAVLLAWTGAVFLMRLSWLAYLVPIPFVLFFATWLRAPDWILERTTWKARFKAVGAVVVPAAIMLAAAPFSRIAQVPDVTPGFNQAVYLSGITPEALETGAMYRRANELYDEAGPNGKYFHNYFHIRYLATERVAQNQEPLKLILAASEREACALVNPATMTDMPIMHEERLAALTAASAVVLENEDKLDEAMDRYFTTFTVNRQLTSFAPNVGTNSSSYVVRETLDLMTQWGIHNAQTEARLREAIFRLEQVDSTVLNSDDAIKSNFILLDRLLAGDENIASALFGSKSSKELGRLLFNLRLLPWEGVRERRLLKTQTRNALEELALVRQSMQRGEEVGSSATRTNWNPPPPSFDGLLSGAISNSFWLWRQDTINSEITFETRRRVTLIMLACQAYRLKHGALPEKLLQLRDEELLAELPNDPMSGRPFVYFPEGIPKPRTDAERKVLEKNPHSLKPDVPCLWSPGANLSTWEFKPNADDPKVIEVHYRRRPISYDPDAHLATLPEYDAWIEGDWFPIPPAE